MNYGLQVMGHTRHRSSGYAHLKTITVNSGQVTGTLSHFPMLVYGTYSYLAFGSGVTNANGYDIIFSSTTAADGSGILPFERVAYNSGTGAVTFFVNVTSMAVGSVIYLLYGNSAISTDQQNQHGTWDANFLQVSHLIQSSGATLLDSTSYGNSSSSNTGTQATGLWGNAVNFTNAGAQFAAFPNGTITPGHNPVSFSAWVKFPDATNYGIVFDPRSATAQGVVLYAALTSGNATATVLNVTDISDSGGSVTNNSWHYMALTFGGGIGGTNSTLTLNVDAAAQVTALFTGAVPTQGATFNIGTKTVAGGATTYGTVTEQELRISNIVRTDAWLKAEYNNQSAPSSFYAIT